MPIYYFEFEIRQTGWVRLDAEDEHDAMNKIPRFGVDTGGIIDCSVETKVVSIDGGEEMD